MGELPVGVVGGGIAGLTTALALQKQGKAVRVYESAARVGGRIHSVADRGVLEAGMQFYYSSYRETFKLLRAFDLDKELVPIHVRGLMVRGGDIQTFDKSWPWLTLLTAPENLRMQGAVARKLFSLITMTPFDFRSQDPLDAIDAAEYFLELGGEAVLELAARPMVTSYAFTEPEGHSLAMLLRIMRLGAFSKMYGLKRGNDSLPKAMAARLDVVHAAVTEIMIDDGRVQGVVIEGNDGPQTVPASQVVCAVRGSQAGALLLGASQLADAFNALSYSNIVLVNLHLDRPLEGRDWTYILSRTDGHRAAFAVELTRRSATMFPDNRSILQVVFADPVAGKLLGERDGQIIAQAATDMETFLPGVAEWIQHTSVVRRPKALPNFPCGMFDQVRAIEGMAASIGGLHLAGDYLRAPLCEGAVRSALAASESVRGAQLGPKLPVLSTIEQRSPC